MTGVSAILKMKYGIEVASGAKTDCPICGHKTLSVKADDSIAKCFHSSCSFKVTVSQDCGDQAAANWVFRCMLDDCRAELFKQKKGNNRSSAYRYIVDERKIHPAVVKQFAIGAIPVDYSIQEYVTEALSLISADESKTNNAKLEEEIDMEIFFDKLQTLLVNWAGWCAFFYEDASDNFCSIKFRQPYTKEIRIQKPFDYAGVFVAKTSDKHLSHILVTEGEFNSLSLKSLELRYRKQSKSDLLPEEINVCAVGGVKMADWVTIARIDSNPVVCYDNDASQAGLDLVTRGLNHTSLTSFTTPNADSDLDEYIRSFDQDYVGAGEGVRRLFEGRVRYERNYESVARKIDNIRANEELLGFLKNRFVAETIIDDLSDRGRFYHDRRQGYVFLHSSRTLIPLQRDEPQYRLLSARYGINGAEHLFKFVFEAVNVHALENGETTDLYRFSHYDSLANRLYVYNNDSCIYRIESDSVEIIDNGADGVLFLDDPHGEPFRIVEVPTHHSPLDQYLFSLFNMSPGYLTVGESKLLLMVWFYSLFFEDILRSKPLLVLLGPKGSGKTVSLRSIGNLLVGSQFEVTLLTDDEKDFDAAVTNSFLVVLDQVESAPKWLNDRLAISATGGSVKRRELYTTNRLVEFTVKCFIAISTITPMFRRDDVADRLLIHHVDRIENNVSDNIFRKNLAQNRNLIMSEVVQHLQRILHALGQHGDGISVGSFRMADFAEFALRISRAHGIENIMRAVLKKASHEQSMFTLDADSTVELVVDLASIRPGKEYDAAELCKNLSRLADSRGMKFKYKGNPRGLAQRLRNIETDLAVYVVMDTRDGGGRKRYYSFKPLANGEGE